MRFGSICRTIQYSVHQPTEFIRLHHSRLLPGWNSPIASLLIVLQQGQFALFDDSGQTELQKQQLRSQFLVLSFPIVQQLHRLGYEADAFDPRTGFPLHSAPGSLCLDDVAVVRATLGYEAEIRGGCLIMLHPHWQTAVYPSILVSSAPPQTLEEVAGPLLRI